jgi:CfrBI restriction endonuclease
MARQESIISKFPESARNLLVVGGQDLLDTLGLPTLRSVVTDVLSGINVRNATEALTQRRLSLIHAALFQMYLGLAKQGLSAEDIIDAAYGEIRDGRTSAEDKIVLRWMLGLTSKQVQNVLRSDDVAWHGYIAKLKENLANVAAISDVAYGRTPLSSDHAVDFDWAIALSMLTAVGAQTLGIRGAEKSLYGKFFEKLIMGSVLSVLGFQLAEQETVAAQSFILSSTSKRESDATAIWNIGQGVRFDIGFIGRGNPEITLDKVTRFERDYEINGTPTVLKTVIIVDVVGKKSSILDLAKAVDGVIVQMSHANWVSQLGKELEKVLDDYVSPVPEEGTAEFATFIANGVQNSPIERIFSVAVADELESDDL